MARYFTINTHPSPFEAVREHSDDTEEGRGLNQSCEEDGGQHDWLLLPKQTGQKHYLMCLKCHQFSHL